MFSVQLRCHLHEERDALKLRPTEQTTDLLGGCTKNVVGSFVGMIHDFDGTSKNGCLFSGGR